MCGISSRSCSSRDGGSFGTQSTLPRCRACGGLPQISVFDLIRAPARPVLANCRGYPDGSWSESDPQASRREYLCCSMLRGARLFGGLHAHDAPACSAPELPVCARRLGGEPVAARCGVRSSVGDAHLRGAKARSRPGWLGATGAGLFAQLERSPAYEVVGIIDDQFHGTAEMQEKYLGGIDDLDQIFGTIRSGLSTARYRSKPCMPRLSAPFPFASRWVWKCATPLVCLTTEIAQFDAHASGRVDGDPAHGPQGFPQLL